jgi:hypothetical protein
MPVSSWEVDAPEKVRQISQSSGTNAPATSKQDFAPVLLKPCNQVSNCKVCTQRAAAVFIQVNDNFH